MVIFQKMRPKFQEVEDLNISENLEINYKKMVNRIEFFHVAIKCRLFYGWFIFDFREIRGLIYCSFTS